METFTREFSSENLFWKRNLVEIPKPKIMYSLKISVDRTQLESAWVKSNIDSGNVQTEAQEWEMQRTKRRIEELAQTVSRPSDRNRFGEEKATDFRNWEKTSLPVKAHHWKPCWIKLCDSKNSFLSHNWFVRGWELKPHEATWIHVM